MPVPTVPTEVRAVRPRPGNTPRPVLPGAASTAVATLVGGPRLAGEVVASTRNLTAVLVDDGTGPVLVCVTGPDAVRLPCAVVTASAPVAVPVGTPAVVGEAELRVGDRAVVTVVRWWPARLPAVPDVALAAARAASEAVPDLYGVRAAADRLGVALRSDRHLLEHAVGGLLGLGPGLTPAGDDVLAGALVALRAVGNADHLAAAIQRARPFDRTTAVSAGLLGYAARGLAVPQLGAVLAALGSPAGDVAGARRRLFAVGHTSGAALYLGTVLALAASAADGAEDAP